MCLQPKEGLEAETFNEMQQMMDWQTKSAKKLGVSLEDFTSAADQAGLQHEEFLGALFGVLSFALCNMPARRVPSFACIRRSLECLLVMIDVCVCVCGGGGGEHCQRCDAMFVGSSMLNLRTEELKESGFLFLEHGFFFLSFPVISIHAWVHVFLTVAMGLHITIAKPFALFVCLNWCMQLRMVRCDRSYSKRTLDYYLAASVVAVALFCRRKGASCARETSPQHRREKNRIVLQINAVM
jgi:hypothetical protein